MSKSYHWMVVILGVVAASALAVADDGDGGDPGVGNGKPIGARPISFDEFKARCAHPEQFDVQRAPQNIRIQCSDVQRDYEVAAPGEVALPATRSVATQLYADKFFVNAEQRSVPVTSKGGTCLRFKEVERALTIERPLSCDDILNLKGELADYCTSSLDIAKGANPKLISVRDTGRVIDTCAAAATPASSDEAY